MFSDTSAAALAAGIKRWIECESPSNDIATLNTMAAMMAGDAKAAGLQASSHHIGNGTGPMLHISNRADGDTREGVLILAHHDTVHPVGTLLKNPARIEEDRLYGPGSYDMKGGIYLAMAAMAALAKPGSTPLPVDLLIVPDEETGSHASREHIEAYAKRARYTLVCEPARANTGACVVARKGTGMLRLAVKGRPSHAGVQHDKGRSAIREMAHQILALEAMTDYQRGVTVSVGTIQGGTVTNTVPEHCSIVVDFRVPTPELGEEVVTRMRALKPVGPDVELIIDAELNRPPMVASEATKALLARAQNVAQASGFKLEAAPMTGGGSDANFTAALGIPTLDGLGPDGDGAHTLSEFIQISTLPKRLAFWTQLLRELD